MSFLVNETKRVSVGTAGATIPLSTDGKVFPAAAAAWAEWEKIVAAGGNPNAYTDHGDVWGAWHRVTSVELFASV